MPKQLEHRQIYAVMTSLAETRIIDLDAPIHRLLSPIAESLSKGGVPGTASLHILCCNEYALVTGLTSGSLSDVERLADSIQSAITQVQKKKT